MIYFTTGDIFWCGAEALVNPVNCVGVMGKGMALKCKKLYPENYKEYREACKWLKPGKLYTHRVPDPSNHVKYIINFPTKDHWRNPSKLEYISEGLDALKDEINTLRLYSITIPALGCGCGGLSWRDVEPLIREKLSDVDCEVYCYVPFSFIKKGVRTEEGAPLKMDNKGYFIPDEEA